MAVTTEKYQYLSKAENNHLNCHDLNGGFSLGNSGSSNNVRKAHTWTICSKIGHYVAWKKWVMWKFFIRSIARSMWMRTVAIRRVDTTSSDSSCFRLPRNGGMFVDTRSGKTSSISKPLSAITRVIRLHFFPEGHSVLSALCHLSGLHKGLKQKRRHHLVCSQLKASRCFGSYS